MWSRPAWFLFAVSRVIGAHTFRVGLVVVSALAAAASPHGQHRTTQTRSYSDYYEQSSEYMAFTPWAMNIPSSDLHLMRAPLIIELHPSVEEIKAAAKEEAAADRRFWLSPDEWVAVFTLTLTISTILLWIETRRSVNDGKDVLQAANRSANAAEKAHHVERAWIFFDDLHFGDVDNATLNGVPIGHAYFVGVKWTNGGRTPALNVNITFEYAVVDASDPVPAFNVGKTRRESTTIVGQGKSCLSDNALFPVSETTAMNGQVKSLIIYSRIEYIDVFEPNAQRHTEVTIVSTFNGLVHLPNGKTIPNLMRNISGAQNGCS